MTSFLSDGCPKRAGSRRPSHRHLLLASHNRFLVWINLEVRKVDREVKN